MYHNFNKKLMDWPSLQTIMVSSNY